MVFMFFVVAAASALYWGVLGTETFKGTKIIIAIIIKDTAYTSYSKGKSASASCTERILVSSGQGVLHRPGLRPTPLLLYAGTKHGQQIAWILGTGMCQPDMIGIGFDTAYDGA